MQPSPGAALGLEMWVTILYFSESSAHSVFDNEQGLSISINRCYRSHVESLSLRPGICPGKSYRSDQLRDVKAGKVEIHFHYLTRLRYKDGQRVICTCLDHTESH